MQASGGFENVHGLVSGWYKILRSDCWVFVFLLRLLGRRGEVAIYVKKERFSFR